MVVGQGSMQLRERLAAQTPSAPPEEAVSGARDDVDPSTPSTDVATTTGDKTLHPDDLVIPDYDSLPAIDIVLMLESLTSRELSGVESYERANRRRRTVLGKIAQLSVDA